MKKNEVRHFCQDVKCILRCLYICLLVSFSTLCSYTTAANAGSDADLLRMLNAEAEKSADINGAAKTTTKTTGNARATDGTVDTKSAVNNTTTKNTAKKPAKDDESVAFQQRFERILENERPATYTFYSKLDRKAQNTVVNIYKDTNKLSIASKKVFDLYFDQLKK